MLISTKKSHYYFVLIWSLDVCQEISIQYWYDKKKSFWNVWFKVLVYSSWWFCIHILENGTFVWIVHLNIKTVTLFKTLLRLFLKCQLGYAKRYMQLYKMNKTSVHISETYWIYKPNGYAWPTNIKGRMISYILHTMYVCFLNMLDWFTGINGESKTIPFSLDVQYFGSFFLYFFIFYFIDLCFIPALENNRLIQHDRGCYPMPRSGLICMDLITNKNE